MICILCIISSSFITAQICDFHGNVIEIEGQETPNIFDTNSTIEYVNEVLIINNKEMLIDDLSEQEFLNRTEFENYLGCAFPISTDFYETLSGNIKSFDLDGAANSNGIQKLDYITFHQYGRNFKFVLVNRMYLFEFVNTISNILKPTTYYEESEILAESYEYVPQTEIAGTFTVIKEAEYETVTEQVLVSEAFTELSIVAAQFQNKYHYFYHETSECTNAIIESVPKEFVTKEESLTFEIIAAEMETVTEQKLDVHVYFGPGFYKRQQINLDTLKQIYIKRLDIHSMKDNCYNLNFIKCANYSEIKDSTIALPQIGPAYLPCINGYKSAGEYCFSEEIEVPASYIFREYQKLITPASANAIIIAPEYTTVMTSVITNKQELEDACIHYIKDSIQYKKLIVPSTIESQEVPATYSTISHNLLIKNPEFEAEESQEEIKTINIEADQNIKKIDHQLKLQTVDLACMHESILSRLIELSFADNDANIYSKAYYQAIIDYQQSEQLAIGAIDESLLESLNISFE